jgi:hypothetical protein
MGAVRVLWNLLLGISRRNRSHFHYRTIILVNAVVKATAG